MIYWTLFQAQNCLTKLYKLDKAQFRQIMRDYVNKDSLNNVVDFLHALLGFCMEPATDSKYTCHQKLSLVYFLIVLSERSHILVLYKLQNVICYSQNI